MADDPIYSHAVFRNRLDVTGTLVAQTALHVGAGQSLNVQGSDLPLVRDRYKRIFLPGSSIRGAMRAHIESLIRIVAPAEASDFFAVRERSRHLAAELDEMSERRLVSDEEADRQRAAAIWNLSNLMDLTFGAPWIAGRVFVRDAPIHHRIGQVETRSGIALNRDTETAEEGLFFEYEVIPAGTRFAFALIAENVADWQLGMLLLELGLWERDGIQLGGFRSRGLGHVQLVEGTYRFIELNTVDDVLYLLTHQPDVISGSQRQQWIMAFRNKLRDVALAREEYNA